MKKPLIISALMVMLLGPVLSASSLVVRLDKNRVSIFAEKVPLHAILRRIAEHGIRVKIDPELNPLVTVAVKDYDIQSGLSIILKSVNHVVVWETIADPSGPVSRVAEIQVFEPGKRSLMVDLFKKSRFEILKDPEDGSLYVKDEILIQLKPGTDRSVLAELLEKIGGTVIEQDLATGVYRIRLPDNSDVPAVRKKISTAPGVSEVEPNYAYPIFSPNQIQDLEDQEAETEFDSRPHAALIAILDSGIAAGTGLDDLIAGSFNAVDPTDSATDVLGHGTQMAYLASGTIQPQGIQGSTGGQVPILAIKVFDENGYTSNYSIMQSIQYAMENNAKIISLSWGSETRSRFLEESLQAAEAKGLIVIGSAGNRPTGTPVYPAAYPSVIGVGALRPDGKRWEQSNFGDFVTLYAPGFGSFPVGFRGGPGSYAGTSISAAFTANIIAGYLTQHPEADKKEVLKMLEKMGSHLN